MKRINIQDFKKGVMELIHRFPAAISFLVLLTIWSCFGIWEIVWPKMTDLHAGIICYYLSIATILSIVLKLWGEEVKNKRTLCIVSIITHLALIADVIYLWTRPQGGINVELIVAHCAYCSALIIAGIFLPYFREKNDLPAWNFTVRMTIFAIICPWVCGFVNGGLSLLLESLDGLFGIKVSERFNFTLALILILTVASCLWMSRLPKGEKKFNRKAFTAKFLTGLIRYLLFPLLAGYIVVLYCYGAKILFTLSLPKGGVCLLVSVLMIGCLLMEFLLYPLLFKEDEEDGKSHRFELWLTRWLPVIILPLLVLMTIAIGRRLSDYGITMNRLYMLTLNLWFYGVCIGLYLMRARRIHWIFLSFAALFLLSAGLPINYCSISHNAVMNHIEHFLDTHEHPDLPMNKKSYHKFLKGLTKEEAESFSDDLKYIRDFYKQEDLKTIVDSSVSLYYWSRDEDTEDTLSINYHYYKTAQVCEIPEGYHQVREVNFSERLEAKDSLTWDFDWIDRHFTIDLQNLPDEKNSDYLWFLPDQDHHSIIEVMKLDYAPNRRDTGYMDIDLHGYLFDN